MCYIVLDCILLYFVLLHYFLLYYIVLLVLYCIVCIVLYRITQLRQSDIHLLLSQLVGEYKIYQQWVVISPHHFPHLTPTDTHIIWTFDKLVLTDLTWPGINLTT